MKNTIALLLLLASLATKSPLIAQSRTSVLQLWLRDNKMLTVVIDGRHYQRYGRTITYVDVPAGEHSIKAYRYIPYKPDPRYDDENTPKNGRAKLVYKGSIRIQAGKMYYCTIDPEYHTMSVRESRDIYLDSRDKTYRTEEQTDFDENQDADEMPAAASKDTSPSITTLSNDELAQLGKDIQKHITTSDKLRHIKQYLANKIFSTQQLIRMMNWLSIERSKLQLAEYSYPRITDPKNFLQASQSLELLSSRQAMISYTSLPEKAYTEAQQSIPEATAKDNSITTIVANAQALKTDTERQNLFTTKLANTALSIQQLIRILGTCTFEGTKLELVQWAHPILIDKQNTLQLLSSFNFLSSKKAIEQLSKK